MIFSTTPAKAGSSVATTRISEAAIRVIVQKGFDAVSIRSVAVEAGVSGGTVQYYFRTREALLVAALNRTIERIADRVGGQPAATNPFDRLLSLFSQLLPLHPASREEMIVWVAFNAAASAHPAVATIVQDSLEVGRASLRTELESARQAGFLRPNLSIETACHILSALVNRLALDTLAATSVDSAQCLELLACGLALVVAPARLEAEGAEGTTDLTLT